MTLLAVSILYILPQYKVFEGIVTDVPRRPESIAPMGAGVSPTNVAGARYPIKVQVVDPVVTDGTKTYSLAYGMGVEAKIVTERGPIVELIWKKFLKSVGKFEHPQFYRLDKQTENTQAPN